MDWNSLDWAILDRLRAQFLAPVPGQPYWTSRDDLAHYDFTFAQRIAWKWDAVLHELQRRHWQPPAGPVLDWGCGSGIAGRRLAEWFGLESFESLLALDQSPLAMEFTVETARRTFPQWRVDRAPPHPDRVGLLLVSHVLNELAPQPRETLLRIARQAQAVIWVEPGTHAESRALIAIREALRDTFDLLAPCTHRALCGLLAPGNQRHWCHFFAPPPPGIMADADWVRFAQRAGIDLRSLPYSFLVLDRPGRMPPGPEPGLLPVAGASRIIGTPRLYKPYARIFSCQHDGVRDLLLPKRDHGALFRALKRGEQQSIYRWELDNDRVLKADPIV